MGRDRIRLDDPAIIESYRRGESVDSIARRMGVDYTAITRRLDRAGVPRRGRSDLGYRLRLDSDEVCRRYRNGETLTSIARSLGVSITTLRLRVKRAGLRPPLRGCPPGKCGPRPRRADIDAIEVARRYAAGETIEALALAYRASKRTILNRLIERGIERRRFYERPPVA